MTDQQGHNGGQIGDETLLAYLHGQLYEEEAAAVRDALARDDHLRRHTEELMRDGEEIADAFAVMLEDAPEAPMRAVFDEMVQQTVPPRDQAPRQGAAVPEPRAWWGWRLAMAASIVIVAFGVGIASALLLTPRQQMMAAKPELRDAVSHYMALYSKATLEQMPSDPMMLARGLRTVSDALDLDLSTPRIEVASAEFKGARILSFKGQPLAQIGYLYNGEKPVALCITKTAEPPHELRTETRWKQSLAYWNAGGYAFVVVGAVSLETAKDVAEHFVLRFP